HLFTCFQDRPPGHPRGSCGQAGAKPLWDYLMAKIERLGRPDIAITATGCLGFCAAGPLMVVYPEGIWYRPRSREDLDE
ncbi:(2Fe-2S) ferredoxin domain-containing protein, partial [Acinetobacter baumannii]